MVDKIAEYGYLKMIPVFAQLPDELLQKIHSKTMLYNYCKGVVIFFEGEPGKGFYYVKSGKVKITKLTEDGREHIIKILSPGDIFAEVLLFNSRPYPATAVAMEDAVVGAIRNHDLEQLVLSNNQLSLELIKALSQRLLYAQQKIKNLALHDVMARTAEMLLRLGREQGGRNREGLLEISLDLSRQDFASLVGTTRETITRTLMTLKKEKVIDFNGHKLILRDIQALHALII